MHTKNITKLILDIFLTILFISLIYPHETGFQFHEIAGLGISMLFIVHIALNWSWFKSISKNIFNTKLKSKPKFFYLLDCISFISVAAIIITGIMISQVLFPSQGMISHTVVLVHKWISYFCLVLFGLHIVLHWRFIIETVPRLFWGSSKPVWGKTVMSLGSIVLILGLLYSQIVASNTGNASGAEARQETARIDSQYQSRPIPDTVKIPAASSSSTGRPDPNNASTSTKTGTAEQNITSPSSQSTSVAKESSNTTKSDQNSSITSGASSGNTGDQITLTDYLGKMFCTGCEKHCSLLALRCDRGLTQLEAAKQNYQAIYGSASLN